MPNRFADERAASDTVASPNKRRAKRSAEQRSYEPNAGAFLNDNRSLERGSVVCSVARTVSGSK